MQPLYPDFKLMFTVGNQVDNIPSPVENQTYYCLIPITVLYNMVLLSTYKHLALL